MKPKIFIDFGKRREFNVNDVYASWHFTQVKCKITSYVVVFCGSHTHICHIGSFSWYGMVSQCSAFFFFFRILCENIENTDFCGEIYIYKSGGALT